MFKKLTPLQQISTWLTVHTKPSLSGVKTPVELFDSMLDGIDLTGKSFLTLNYEAAILLAKKKVAAANITLVTNSLEAKADMDLVGANTILVDNESEALTKLQELNMKFDVVVANPPYNNSDTQREGTNHRGQGDNLAKMFMMRLIDMFNDRLLVISPTSRLYTSGVKRLLVDKGLYIVSDVTSHFKSMVNANFGSIAFYAFNGNETLPLEDYTEFEAPTNNLGPLFTFTTGARNSREIIEPMLQEEVGAYKVYVTTSKVMYTNDIEVVNYINDSSRGRWRVVMNNVSTKSSVGPLSVATPEDTLCFSTSCLFVDSREQAEILINYLNTQEVKNILASVRSTVTNSKKSFSALTNPLI